MTNSKAFRKYNGFLRVLSMIFSSIALGLTLSKFRKTELNELIYLATLTFCTGTSILHFLIAVLTPCAHSGKCFKIADFIFLFISGAFLLVSSVMMIQVAATKGKILDYRFQDTKVVLVRATAGVFGVQASFLYFALAYLTITQKQLVFCQRLPKKKKEDKVETGGNDPGLVENIAVVPNSPKAPSIRCFVDRFTWRRLLVDEVLEARVITLFFGAANVGLLADSFEPNYEVEEYFFSMVIICFGLTFFSHAFYAFGIINLKESTCAVLDVLLQYFSSVNLLAGGTLMLGSVIQNNSYGYQYKSIERTTSAVLGVFTGLLYLYIGTNVKRAYFSRLRSDVTYAVVEAPGTSRGKASKTNNNKNNTPVPTNSENIQESPSGCSMT